MIAFLAGVLVGALILGYPLHRAGVRLSRARLRTNALKGELLGMRLLARIDADVQQLTRRQRDQWRSHFYQVRNDLDWERLKHVQTAAERDMHATALRGMLTLEMRRDDPDAPVGEVLRLERRAAR